MAVTFRTWALIPHFHSTLRAGLHPMPGGPACMVHHYLMSRADRFPLPDVLPEHRRQGHPRGRCWANIGPERAARGPGMANYIYQRDAPWLVSTWPPTTLLLAQGGSGERRLFVGGGCGTVPGCGRRSQAWRRLRRPLATSVPTGCSIQPMYAAAWCSIQPYARRR